MEKILEAQGKNNEKKAQRAKRVYVAPQLVRISKVVSETRYDRERAIGFAYVIPG